MDLGKGKNLLPDRFFSSDQLVPPSIFSLVLRSLGEGGKPFIGAVAKLKDIMQLTNSPRGIAAEPGQGRERMGG